MDTIEVKAFNSELSGLYENRPPISKAKMTSISKGAIKAIKFYKHVVHSVEKFIQKCKPEYKVPGLYVIDSIVRQSRHQFGREKDVFAPRFAKNMQLTFANLFRCPPEDKRNIIRVLNLWQKNNVFNSDVIQPLLDMADPNHPLHQELQQPSSTANGSSLNVTHNTTDNKLTPQRQDSPRASTPMGDQFQDEPSGMSIAKFNRKLLNDFEYDSDDEPSAEPLPQHNTQQSQHNIQHSHSQHNTQHSYSQLVTQHPHSQHNPQLPNPQHNPQLQPNSQLPQIQHNPPLPIAQHNPQLPLAEHNPQLPIAQQNPQYPHPQHNIQLPQLQHNPQLPMAQHNPQYPQHNIQHLLPQHAPPHMQAIIHSILNPNDPLSSILNPEVLRQLQTLQLQLAAGLSVPNYPNLMPMMTDMSQQNQTQNIPFMNMPNSQIEQPAQVEPKEDVANESDIEFVETGPQVIEIPDANDSRSPSPVSRRHRSRSRSQRRRRRTRSRSPRRRHGRDKDRDKSYKERELDKEKQREREKKGLPPIKKENLSVCSTTLWVGHLSKLATPEELSDLFSGFGGVASIDVVAPRGCAFVVMERRRDAARALSKLDKYKLHSKEITVAWAAGKGVKGREWKDYWEAELGVAYLPWTALHARWLLGALSLDALEDGGAVDEETLPPWLPPRIISKPTGDGMGMGPPMLPPTSMPLPSMSSMPPSMPGPGQMSAPLTAPPALPMTVPPPGMPPGMPPPIPTGMRPPSITPGVPGMQSDGSLPPPSQLMNYPPGMQQTGMVGGYLSGLMGMGGLVLPMHAPPHTSAAPHLPTNTQLPPPVPQSHPEPADDAMELDTDEAPADRSNEEPPLTIDQIQALLSKPPPTFNSLELPPDFMEPPPDTSQPPPDDKRDDERRDRDKERRDRRDTRDRDRRDTRDRRDRPRDRDRDRDDRRERERERDRDRGRDRRERDRERDRDRERERDKHNSRATATRDRSGEKSPRGEKSLQERLWEMANGGNEAGQQESQQLVNQPQSGQQQSSQPLQSSQQQSNICPSGQPPSQHNSEDGGTVAVGGASSTSGTSSAGGPTEKEGGWSQLPPPRQMPPMFRAGPWMDLQPSGPFGSRFNGPPFPRPPFDRPPFDSPMFERPRYNRMPFVANRPPNRPSFEEPRIPFDGSRPRFDGPRPPFENPRPPFDGPRPPYDTSRPPFDGQRQTYDASRPPYDGPRLPFDGSGPLYDGPRPPFDGPRPPFDGSRPPFDGPRPPFDGPRPSCDGPRPHFDRPRQTFEGPRSTFENNRHLDGFDGDRSFEDKRFDSPAGEFFDRGNRRFDEREQLNDREQFNDRAWNGNRERDYDRRGDWDERRRERGREHEDRFRERNDRRRNYEDRTRQPREERIAKRDKERKSRWGAADEDVSVEDKGQDNADPAANSMEPSHEDNTVNCKLEGTNTNVQNKFNSEENSVDDITQTENDDECEQKHSEYENKQQDDKLHVAIDDHEHLHRENNLEVNKGKEEEDEKYNEVQANIYNEQQTDKETEDNANNSQKNDDESSSREKTLIDDVSEDNAIQESILTEYNQMTKDLSADTTNDKEEISIEKQDEEVPLMIDVPEKSNMVKDFTTEEWYEPSEANISLAMQPKDEAPEPSESRPVDSASEINTVEEASEQRTNDIVKDITEKSGINDVPEDSEENKTSVRTGSDTMA